MLANNGLKGPLGTPSLRHSLFRVLVVFIRQDHSCFEILEDQFQNPWIGDAFAKLPHEFLMFDGVEERLQIAMEATGGADMDDRRVARRVRPPEEEAESIHNMAPLSFWEGFFVHPPDGMMRAPSRSKPVGTTPKAWRCFGQER
ncbi:hypothetical protein V2O64_19165 [Verrucomicrobiaceae bacterium 227]